MQRCNTGNNLQSHFKGIDIHSKKSMKVPQAKIETCKGVNVGHLRKAHAASLSDGGESGVKASGELLYPHTHTVCLFSEQAVEVIC